MKTLSESAMKEYCDYYFRKAKQENYPARSVYKLKEMDARHHLLRKGMKVLDLGAAPGSWSLAAAEKIGESGLVLACDIQDAATAFPPCVRFIKSDVFAPEPRFLAALAEFGPFDLAMSDMAPATTGSRVTDHARSINLALEALRLAVENLKKRGHFVVKVFMGPDMGELLEPMRENFAKVKNFKPKSSRPESRETFYLGLDFKGSQTA